MELVHLTSRDFEEAMDFLNLVFSQTNFPHDFARRMPMVCRPEEAYMNRHLAIKRDGRIRAMLLSSPSEVTVAGRRLRVAGIGSVATHLNERGNGLMRQLMEQAIREMEEEGTDLSALGGQRQRYQYYGYDRCGLTYSYTLTARNLRHSRYPVPDWRFEPIREEDISLLEQAQRLYEEQPLHASRGGADDFYRFLISRHDLPYACLDREGRMVGYLTVDASRKGAAELVADSQEHGVDLMAAWIASNGLDQLTRPVHPWERQMMRTLGGICESFYAAPDHQYRIFHWERVVQAFLELKRSYAPLADGELVLEIQDWGRLAVSVRGGEPFCERTQTAPHLSLSSFEAMRAVFGPFPADCSAALPADRALLFQSWFPLPLSWWGQDNV